MHSENFSKTDCSTFNNCKILLIKLYSFMEQGVEDFQNTQLNQTRKKLSTCSGLILCFPR